MDNTKLIALLRKMQREGWAADNEIASADAIEALEAEVERLNTGWQSANALLLRRSADLVTAQAQLTTAEPAQPERPINCGTGYCSCIECPYEQAQPEPVYQYQLANGNWIDQSKESHDYNARHGQATLRTVYTAIKQGGGCMTKDQAIAPHSDIKSDGRLDPRNSFDKPAPDCRTCDYYSCYEGCTRPATFGRCTNGDQHKPAPSVVLWRTEL